MNLSAVLLPSLALIALRTAEAPPPSKAVAARPDPAQELVQARCTSCHDMARYAGERRTGAQWTETVVRMRDHGARIGDEEVPVIAAFLARTQGR